MKLKKFCKAGVTAAMTMSMSVMPLLAANANSNMDKTDYSITIQKAAKGDSGTKSYKAYRVIKGDIDETDGVKTLSNVDWGEDVSVTDGKFDGKTAKQTAKAITTSEEATVFANAINANLTGGTALTYDEASGSYKATGLKPGYYLIKEELGSTDDEYEASTAFIMQVVGNTTAKAKSDIPSVEKKVLDQNDTTEDAKTAALDSEWEDSADYDAYANDKVPFKITATLPSDNDDGNGFSNYKTYKLVFNDTFEAGLSAPSTDIADYDIYVGTSKLTDEEKTAIGASVTTSANGFNLSVNDIKKYAGTTAGGTVSVVYKLTLNKDTAVTGSAGQANKIKLTYSNNPNTEGEGHTGQTPEDTVRVFTYKVNIDKVDEDQQALEGAVFKLDKKAQDGSWSTVAEEIPFTTADDKTKFTMSGLDDGTYRVTETATPSGYNSIKPFTFTVTATHEATSDDPQLTALAAGDVQQEALLGDIDLSNEIQFTSDLASGAMSTAVVNEKGIVLPETGDIGTILFYLAGLGLISGSVIYIKRRKANENN